jgi:hypothetical protein
MYFARWTWRTRSQLPGAAVVTPGGNSAVRPGRCIQTCPTVDVRRASSSKIARGLSEKRPWKLL